MPPNHVSPAGVSVALEIACQRVAAMSDRLPVLQLSHALLAPLVVAEEDVVRGLGSVPVAGGGESPNVN